MTNSDYYNYIFLGITSSKIPPHTHLIYEHSALDMYIADSTNLAVMLKSEDKGNSWETIVTHTGYEIQAFYPDRGNLRLYYLYTKSDAVRTAYIDLTDDSTTNSITFAGELNYIGRDVLIYGGTDHVAYTWDFDGTTRTSYWDGGALAYTQDMGDPTARTYDQTQTIIVGSDFYFLWKWSDENVELWKYTPATGNFVEMEDCGANTELPSKKQQAIAYDGSDILYFVLQDTIDLKYYLWSYVISLDILTKLSEFNVALMLDRNVHGTTPPFTLEKGFDITQDKIYQIPSTYSGKLNLISVFNFINTIIAISDHFVIDSGGKVYEMVSYKTSFSKIEIETPRNNFPTAQALRVRDDFSIIKGMIMQIIGTYTSKGVSTENQIIFEGYVVDYDEQKMEKVWLESPARELLEIKPLSGEFRDIYSGRTDEIIVDLITDYCGYVTSGTLVAGTAKGNVFFDGDTSLFTILKDFAKEDGFVWALTPIGALNYHISVDSGVDIDETDNVWGVETTRPHRDINRVDVRGAFINGVEIRGFWDDEASQNTNGFQRFTYRDSKIRTVALANALALQLGTNLAVNAKEANIFYKDPSKGLIQVAEEITLQYNTTNINIASAQFILDYVKFFAIQEYSDITATDTLLIATEGFRNQTIDEQVEQNNTLIQQNRESLNTKTGWINTPVVTLSFTDGSRTLTITPTGDSFTYWIQGTKYTKLAADTFVIDDTEGLWYIYYTKDTLAASQVKWVIRDGDKAMVAIVYWDATNNIHTYLGYELHSFEKSPADHDEMHHSVGTNFSDGLALVHGTGGDDGKVAMDSGVIHDEDIEINITDGVGSGLFEQELGNTTVFAAAQIPVYYRSGASAWRKYAAGDYPFYDNSGGDNVHYNLYSAPNWSSQEATNSAKYIAMWIFGTNNQTEPVVALMGQSESSTLNAAKDVNTLESIEYGTLPFEELKILYRLIFKSDSSWAHTEDLRSVANIPGGTYVPSPQHDSDAIHDNIDNEITAITPKATPVSADEFIIEDSEASFIKKALTFTNLKAAIDTDPNAYYCRANAGHNGFIEGVYFGSQYFVLLTDVNAGVESNVYIKEGGSFKLSIITMNTVNNLGFYANGRINISYDIHQGSSAWDVNEVFNVALQNNLTLNIQEYGTPFTVADNSKVGIDWSKTNDPGRTGGIYVYGFVLIRQ